MEMTTNAYRTSAGERDGKKPLERCRSMWEDGIEMDHKKKIKLV
jgi:hypothetical protein